MFIKVARRRAGAGGDDVAAASCSRACSVAILLAQAGWRAALAGVRATSARVGLCSARCNAALPFWLIAWGEKHIDSGMAAIANSTVPIFVALLAIRLDPSERSRGLRLVGVLLGLVGVGVLTGLPGWRLVGGRGDARGRPLLGSATRGRTCTPSALHPTAPLVLATVAISTAAFLILPFGLCPASRARARLEALGAVVALGVLGTSVAYLVHYRLVTRYGSSRSSLVTYLIPAFALFYGSVFLDEPLTLEALLGLALILGGVGLGSGLVRRRRVAA